MKLKGSAQDPLWYKDAIIYETHVKAFFDSNDDGVGDFQGLLQKLDYLQDLGVTCLWLLPFFPSPLRDDGYDISDYRNVHSSYGTLEDFKAFLNAAHERNLQVLMELVVNHTSDQHPWFQAARKAPPGSPERDYYVWSDTPDKYRDARIIFTDTEKSNWAWDPEAHAYYWHRFFSHQPDLNFDNPAVTQEVIRAMQFWLDLGADGFRLDAIPYLVEREGTNCENLPETHAIIRQIRRALDERYTNRMLLAEANQWPSDVLAYFGNEDECHMAFHFPLMPRIFMALRLEDRHPITEIMAQTPPIPYRCQWGLFLRNHDELTLEMVTDEERDYMYLAYSADPRMRLNVGIRRRLAPLMDNNRRRIELLNSLLFSFPGTPIIYYGDEIGMGDNIYLGDRNGVRTPMQWTPDRNAGFSRANPAKLYSPPIMDPLYGYEAVNVEAQLSDSSSLLHWMRNMIALRKLFRVFGRGSLEFLNVENRKVLAYLRRYDEEQILCVANLSRFSQPMELNLSALAGMTPVEMLGFTEFPTISKAPYRLTLGPYGFFWFELQGAPEPVEVRATQEAEAPCPAVIESAHDLFKGAAREALESKIFPEFLPKQRWFGAKMREIQRTRIADWAWLDSAASAMVLVEVTYAGGSTETYDVPLTVKTGAPAQELLASHPESMLCDARVGGAAGGIFDALADERSCLALLHAIRANTPIAGSSGTVYPVCSDAFRAEEGETEPASSRAPGSSSGFLKVSADIGEQSNTSIVFGERWILKLYRRLEEGINPDYEIGRYLTEQNLFRAIAPVIGAIEYERQGRKRSTLAMLQQLVPNQGDGWRMTVDELGRYYEHCATIVRTEEFAAPRQTGIVPMEIPDEAREVIGMYLDAAATLGCRTAEMHLALAAQTDDPAFRPEPLTQDTLRQISSSMRQRATDAFRVLKTAISGLADEAIDTAALALGLRSKLMERFRALDSMEPGMVRIRLHGDLHLGQVLRVENDFVILDFEGEPARPIEERRAKQAALKDVAGMLRSFSYAAYAALLSFIARHSEDYDKLEPWAAFWEKWTSTAFLSAYLKTAAGAPFLPTVPEHFSALLDAFLLDKALYELLYELNHRPSWVRIPLHGIVDLARAAGA